jgi:hypothetical protein
MHVVFWLSIIRAAVINRAAYQPSAITMAGEFWRRCTNLVRTLSEV